MDLEAVRRQEDGRVETLNQIKYMKGSWNCGEGLWKNVLNCWNFNKQ